MPRPHHRCGCGAWVTRPRCGLRPKRPQQADGMRIDPPPSPPIATGTSPAATATAVPPLDPPGERRRSQGLRVSPCSTDSVNGHWPNSGIAVLPTTTAPAARSRRTTSPSAPAGVTLARPPKVVTQPATSSSSLTATGTPCSGPRSAAGTASRADASARASSSSTAVNALSRPSWRRIRSTVAATSSRELTCPSRTACAWPVTPAKKRSSSMRARLLAGTGPRRGGCQDATPQRRRASTSSARVTWTSSSRSTRSDGACAHRMSPGP